VIIPHDSIKSDVLALWKSGGLPPGQKTGWSSLNGLYSVSTGQWTCVTGVPNSGKSEWLDALLVNLAKNDNWKFFVFSPENWPLALHHAKIIEKYIGKPFTPGPTPRADEDEVEAAEEWMRGKFFFCKPDKPDVLAILDEAGQLKPWGDPPRFKVGVVIDPWNQLEHYRPSHMTETEYISQTLSYVIERVREYNIHLWLVAHPAKLYRDRDGKYPVPTPRDIAGSAHFWNKADNCITVHRDQVEGSQDVDIHVQKVRWKHIGRIGLATLRYDKATGRYFDIPNVMSISRYLEAKTGEESPL